MRNPFLQTDHYSIAQHFKKRPNKRLSTNYAIRNDRVYSLDSAPSYLAHQAKPFYFDQKYQKYIHDLRKIQAESAKIYGLDVLRYQPQQQTTNSKENTLKVSKKPFQSKKCLNSMNTFNISRKSSILDSVMESQYNIKKKKHKQSLCSKRGSILASMLNINLKGIQQDIESYDSDEQEYPQLISKRRFSREYGCNENANQKQKSYHHLQKYPSKVEIQSKFQNFRKSSKVLKKSQLHLLNSEKRSFNRLKSTRSMKILDHAPNELIFRRKSFFLFKRVEY